MKMNTNQLNNLIVVNMQERLNLKLIFVTLLLLVSALVAYYYWVILREWILGTLKSDLLTFLIWTFLVVISLVHFFIYNEKKSNAISDKDGLEKPLDYFQFIGTYGVILTFAKTFGCEFFVQWNFPEMSQCDNFNKFDQICMVSCVFLLINYSLQKIYPVLEDIFIKKVSIQS